MADGGQIPLINPSAFYRDLYLVRGVGWSFRKEGEQWVVVDAEGKDVTSPKESVGQVVTDAADFIREGVARARAEMPKGEQPPETDQEAAPTTG